MVAPISYLEVNCNMVMKKVSVDVVYGAPYTYIHIYVATYIYICV